MIPPRCGLLVLACIALAAASAAWGRSPNGNNGERWGPDVVLLNELEDLYAPVPFDHRIHAEMAGMWDGCVTCHHHSPQLHVESPQASDVPTCKSCHPLTAEGSTVRQPSLNAAYHRQCLDCHRDWTGANDCVICHEPKDAAAERGETPAHDAALPTPADVVGRMCPPLPAPTVKNYRARFTPVAGGNVTFRHDDHVDRYDLACADCHRRDTCASCHARDAQPGQHKPMQTAWSWSESHEPCTRCHDQDRCTHCHYRDEQAPPPPFEHQTTGQVLDEAHAELRCRECHSDAFFRTQPVCGDAACHPSDPTIALPDQRPGPTVQATLVRRDGVDPAYRPGRPPPMLARATPGFQPPIPGWDAPQPAVEPAPPPDPRLFQPVKPLPPELRAPPPTEVIAPADCATADCHADVKDHFFVHGPVNLDDCLVCHQLIDAQTHQFVLLRQDQALCAFCHEFAADQMPVVHEPVRKGECLGCHDPHGSMRPSLTREADEPQLCGRCHESIAAGSAFMHTPVARGQCLVCHAPHGAPFDNLLAATGVELCATCHQAFDNRDANPAIHVHKALDEGCGRCHNVHGSDFPLALTDQLVPLCTKCHEQVGEQVAQAAVMHSVVTEKRACLNCHTPHGGAQAKLMSDVQAKLCLQCHAQKIVVSAAEHDAGRVIAAIGPVNDPNMFKHTALLEGACSGCHTPHGGALDGLLVDAYMQANYSPYQPDNFALCFGCHDAQLAEPLDAQSPDAPPVTAFRNGDMNLHQLHVNRKKGRNCRACHATHASVNPQHLLALSPFGKWDMPINYTRHATGGSCRPGCHKPFAYDRDNPVQYPPKPEGNRP